MSAILGPKGHRRACFVHFVNQATPARMPRLAQPRPMVGQEICVQSTGRCSVSETANRVEARPRPLRRQLRKQPAVLPAIFSRGQPVRHSPGRIAMATRRTRQTSLQARHKATIRQDREKLTQGMSGQTRDAFSREIRKPLTTERLRQLERANPVAYALVQSLVGTVLLHSGRPA